MKAELAAGKRYQDAYDHVSIYWTDPKLCDDQSSVAPHNSGGAVDVTLSFEGKDLDMGTDFDAMVPESRTDYFMGYTSSSGRLLEVKKNRDMLKSIMLDAGFTNYPEEWWHYDLGTRFWARDKASVWQYGSMEDEISLMGC